MKNTLSCLQTLGEEYAVVHADWPQEYVENLRLVDEKVNTMLKKIIPLAREQLARIDRSANITKAHYLSPEEAKSAPVFIARASENLIHYLKEVIGENLSEIAKLLAIEKALFATEINFLMSEEAGKHFKENGGVYLAEIIRMLNKFFDLRDGNGDKVINFVGSYRLGTKTEDVGHSPVTKTFLHLEMWDSHYDKNGHQVGYLKASAHIEYVLGSQKFYVKVYKLSSYGHSHHEPPALFGDMDSNSMTEILTYVLGRCGYYWAGSRRA
ncbi:hypothetical protein J4210_04670 [Candidatus Woesearchaeota archaeon]|nr:hypothetical protein [Candidatus Woesearchaeota archaeon]